MEKGELLDELFDKKLLDVIRLIISNKDKEFYLQEIAKASGVPLASAFRIVNKLNRLMIVNEVKVKKFKIYRCANNDTVTFLESFLKTKKDSVQVFVDEVKKIDNVEELILQGNETGEKAVVIVIGSGIQYSSLKKICEEIKENNNYTITALIHEREQYEQMANMGFYSGKKKVLLKKAILH